MCLAACSPAATQLATTPSASPIKTPTVSPSAVGIHFVLPNPATAKTVGSQSTGDAFSAIVAFHELGLRAGQGVSYRVAGTGTVNYSCFRTDGTLASAPGTEQLVTAGVSGNQRLIADASGEVNGVIVIPPPSPRNAACPAGYAIGAWRSAFSQLVVTDIDSHISWQAPDMANQGE